MYPRYFKKKKNVLVCLAVPSEKRETVQIGYSSHKRKRRERETKRVLASRKRRKSRRLNIIEIEKKKNSDRYKFCIPSRWVEQCVRLKL